MTGTIKTLNNTKGFGFVRTNEGTEYFFHRSGVKGLDFDELTEGTTVTFDSAQSPKGRRAENVRPK